MSDKTLVETFEVQGLSVEIHTDPGPSDPEAMTDAPVWLGHFHRQFWRAPEELPFSNGEQFVAWYARYNADEREREDEVSVAEMRARAEEMQEQWEVFIVRAYIHGSVSLALEGSGAHTRMPDQQWDVSRCGVILIDKVKWHERIGTPPAPEDGVTVDQTDWRKIAEAHVKEWNQYLGGEVYGYVVKDGVADEVDSCWGFYGIEDAREEGRAAAEASAEQLKKEAQEFEKFCESLDEETLDELVIDAKSAEASAINNEGKEAQVRYLLEFGVTKQRLQNEAG